MKRSCPKSTLTAVSLIVGSLMSACADSGEDTGKKNTHQKELASGVFVLTPQAEKDLRFGENDVAVVFVVDMAGKMKAFVKPGSKVVPLKLPMHAGNIAHLETLTTFRTTNPHYCWVGSGSDLCLDFH